AHERERRVVSDLAVLAVDPDPVPVAADTLERTGVREHDRTAEQRPALAQHFSGGRHDLKPLLQAGDDDDALTLHHFGAPRERADDAIVRRGDLVGGARGVGEIVQPRDALALRYRRRSE